MTDEASASGWGDVFSDTAQSWVRELLKSPSKLLEFSKQLLSWLNSDPSGKKRQVLVIGPGGVGKSTLGLLLSGRFQELLASVGNYTESLDVEEYELDHEPKVEIVVPPGQPHRRYSWDELQKGIADSQFRGIIFVASYGYHSIGDYAYTEHPLYRTSDSTKQFVKKYVDACRKQELAILRELLPYLKVARQKLWLLTIVTKQDLWWSNNDKVHKHYSTGDYGAEVKDLQNNKDKTLFRHETVLCSLVISRFVTGQNDVLHDNAGGYDDPQRLDSLDGLLSKFNALRKWESEK